MEKQIRRTTFSQKCGAIGVALGYFALYYAVQLAGAILLAIGYSVYFILQNSGDSDTVAELVTNALGSYDALLLLTVLCNALTVLICCLLLSARKKKFSNEVGLHRFSRDGYLLTSITAPVAMGFALSLLSSLTLMILAELIPPIAEAMESFSEQTAVFDEGSTLLSVIATVISAPLVEEILFRGLIYTRLRRALSPFSAMLISSLLFGIAHGTLIHMLYTVPLGILMCVYYDRYRSLWAPILLHFGFNVAGTALGYFWQLPIWFMGICLLFVAFGITTLCRYKTDVSDRIWNIAMQLPPKKTYAPQLYYYGGTVPVTQAPYMQASPTAPKVTPNPPQASAFSPSNTESQVTPVPPFMPSAPAMPTNTAESEEAGETTS